MFKRSLTGRIILKLETAEKVVLGQLFDQMDELLDTEIEPLSEDPLARLINLDGPTEISSDPAVARLFPNGYSSDDHASADFRRYTEQDLRQEKLDALTSSRATLEREEMKSALTADQAQAWLRSLNDLRLVLGTRLGVGEDFDEDSDDPGYHLYSYLTYLQGTLIDCLT
jgi:hypothetical protein